MSSERLFLDTSFAQALLNKRDQHHSNAVAMQTRLRQAKEVWTTEAVLIEIGNALSSINRSAATSFIRQCYNLPNVQVVTVDRELLSRALQLYEARQDKQWGLTDCVSFVVMVERELHDAITSDVHFRQAGFNPLLSS